MSALYGRTVFFVENAEQSLRYYVDQLGFTEDWNSGDGVLQVSLLGFELILNEVGAQTRTRAGHGRVFIGLEEEQRAPLFEHLSARHVQIDRVEWGRPTHVVRDLDGNELFFWE